MSRRVKDVRSWSNEYLICVCEGNAEEAVIHTLLDVHCLWFERENLVGRKITRKRKAEEIETEFLQREYEKPVSIARILDSKREQFRLGRLYAKRFSVFNFYTRPEIEMLLIIAENAFDKYSRSNKSNVKPSTFCKEELFKGESIKSLAFWQSYFADADKLVRAIQEYHRLHNKGDEYDLSYLLKNNV